MRSTKTALPLASLVAALALLAAGCGDDDGGTDAGHLDAGRADAGTDAGVEPDVDAGSIDGGESIDAGHDSDAGDDSEAGDDSDAGADAGSACVLDRDVISGDATTYVVGSGTACGAGITPWLTLRAAVSPTVYEGSASCGTCAEVTGAGGTHVVLLDDLCPECGDEDLDLSGDAFMAITGATTLDGRYPITWQLVPCEPPGNVFYDFQGSNPYYVKVRLTQQRNPVERVEIQRAGGAWAEASRTTDGFFTLSPGEALPTPLQLRATDVFGDVIQFSAPDLSTTAPRDTGAQFAIDCAP